LVEEGTKNDRSSVLVTPEIIKDSCILVDKGVKHCNLKLGMHRWGWTTGPLSEEISFRNSFVWGCWNIYNLSRAMCWCPY
jgi:hypothetical protein